MFIFIIIIFFPAAWLWFTSGRTIDKVCASLSSHQVIFSLLFYISFAWHSDSNYEQIDIKWHGAFAIVIWWDIWSLFSACTCKMFTVVPFWKCLLSCILIEHSFLYKTSFKLYLFHWWQVLWRTVNSYFRDGFWKCYREFTCQSYGSCWEGMLCLPCSVSLEAISFY